MRAATTTRSAITATGRRPSFAGKVLPDGVDLDIAEGATFPFLAALRPSGARPE